jgi:hypothetical protein
VFAVVRTDWVSGGLHLSYHGWMWFPVKVHHVVWMSELTFSRVVIVSDSF